MTSSCRRILAASIALATLASAPGASAQAVIGLDAVHGFAAEDALATGSRYEQLRAVIDALGLTRVPLSGFGAPQLAGLDVLVLKIAYPDQLGGSDYSQAEAADIQAFVAGGGALLAIADTGTGSSVAGLNLVLQPYAIGFSASLAFLTASQTFSRAGLVGHPVFAGVREIDMLGFRFIDFTAGTTATDLTVGTADLIAVDAAGRRVMLVGDSSLWKDDEDGDLGVGVPVTIETGGNRAFLASSLRWLAAIAPPPNAVPALPPPLLGVAGLAILAAGAALRRSRESAGAQR